MTSAKYIGMDVHKESISIAVMNGAGKIVMECVIQNVGSAVQAEYGMLGKLSRRNLNQKASVRSLRQ